MRHGDNEWGDIVRWTLNALITAEELGVTSVNLDEMSAGTDNPEINRLLGTEGDLGAMLGLDKDWAKRAVGVAGNYGEVFEKNIGESTPIGLARGLNAQWTQGGLLYAPPNQHFHARNSPAIRALFLSAAEWRNFKRRVPPRVHP